jgi:amidase
LKGRRRATTKKRRRARKHPDNSTLRCTLASYTSQWNLLDYPALVFPVTKADPEKDVPLEGYTPMNEKDAYNQSIYAPEKYRDAPVSLQVVGRRYDDEKVFQAFELIKSMTGLPFATFPC